MKISLYDNCRFAEGTAKAVRDALRLAGIPARTARATRQGSPVVVVRATAHGEADMGLLGDLRTEHGGNTVAAGSDFQTVAFIFPAS